MNDPCPVLFQVADASVVGAARRGAMAMAGRLGFDEVDCGRVGLVVTEAANNLLLHGGGGDLICRSCSVAGSDGIEVSAVDRGCGIDNLKACMQDGFSSKGTCGTGLGAMMRLSDRFDIYTRPGLGTAIAMQLWHRREAPRRVPGLIASHLAMPMPGEEVCGDAAAEVIDAERALFLVADGLGHGAGAAEAANEAVRVFRAYGELRPGQILAKINQALNKTRGAVVAIAEVDLRRQEVCYAGIGNIAAYLEDGATVCGMVSHSGIVGHTAPRIREYTYPWSDQSLLLMHSDGIKSRCYINDRPGLSQRDPGLIASYTFHHGKRGADDATILVAGQGAEFKGE